MATLGSLQTRTSSTPLLAFSILAGAVGACLTHASRTGEDACCRLAAGLIRSALSRQCQVLPPAVAPDALLASRLKPFLEQCSLPSLLGATLLERGTLFTELADAIRYTWGSQEDRTAVETSRLGNITRAPLLRRYIVAPSPSTTHARELIESRKPPDSTNRTAPPHALHRLHAGVAAGR